MVYPVSAGDNDSDGVKIKPQHMEKDKLYHCVFREKILLFYKDSQGVLNCYEVEEPELVEKVKACIKDDDVEKIFNEYIERKNLKH